MAKANWSSSDLHSFWFHNIACNKDIAFNVADGKSIPQWDNYLKDLYEKNREVLVGQSFGGDGKTSEESIFKNQQIYLFHMLRIVSHYFQGQFEPKSENEEVLADFYAAWDYVITGWYFNDVWLGYGDEFVEAERSAITSNDKDSHRYKWWCKLRVYTRTTSDPNYPGKVTFRSAISNVAGLVFDESKLVHCSANGSLYWLRWRDLCKDLIALIQKFKVQLKAVHKRHVFITKNQLAFNKEMLQFQNDEIYIQKNMTGVQGANLNMFKPYEFIPPDFPIKYLSTIQAYFDYEAAFLGMSGKGILHKESGVTPGEAQQNMVFISSIQNRLFMSLKEVCIRLRKTFNIDIDIINNASIGSMFNFKQNPYEELQAGKTNITQDFRPSSSNVSS